MKQIIKLVMLIAFGYVIYKAFKYFTSKGNGLNSTQEKTEFLPLKKAELVQFQGSDKKDEQMPSNYYEGEFTYANNPYWFPTDNPLINLQIRLAEMGQI